MDTIGTNLKRYRLLCKISQRKLSELSGISRNYISEVESGVYNNVSVFYICNFCKALKITPNDLIPEYMYREEREL